MRNKVLFFLLLLVGIAAQSQATAVSSVSKYEQEKYDIGYIGIKNGLANNAVTSVYKDKRGLMWFGTYDGISRYDGYNFLNYRNEPNDLNSLVNNRVVSICGTQNEIWIGTKGGISVYSYLTNRFSPRYAVNPKTGKNERISFVINQIKDYKTNLYIATAGKGLLYCTQKAKEITFIPLSVNGKLQWDYHVQAIDFDTSGKLWGFVQGVGVVAMDTNTNQLSVVFSEILNGTSIFYDPFSNIWVGVEEGLLKYNTVNKTYHVYSNQEVRYPIADFMYKQDTKELWIATNGNGVVQYNYAANSFSSLNTNFRDEKLNSNAISSLYSDSANRVWIGTLRGGVNRVESKKSPFLTVSKNEKATNTLPSDFILSLCEQDNENLWIGTDGGGASLWNRKNNSFTNYSYNANSSNSLTNNFVSAIVKDDKGTWFGTYGGGISLFNAKTRSFKKYSLFNPKYKSYQKNIWVMYRSKDKVLWAASPDDEGLYRYNEATDKFDFVDAKINGIISITEDAQGYLWLGNFTGIYRYNPKTAKSQLIQLIKYPVRSIVSISSTKMLIGTEGRGLMIFNPQTLKGKFLTQKDGISNNSVLNIVRDNQGAYWCSTYNGLFVYNDVTGKITTYHDTDGLQSNQFNYNAALKLSTGEIVFGGIKGFNVINTKINCEAHDFPKLIINSIKVNNKAIEESGLTTFGIDKLKLPYDESMLNIDFAALEYSLPEKISYAYFLEGWDSQWHYVDNIKSANYSRLTEGDYVLKIKSTNAEGVWNTTSISLPVTISPPWYRSIFAYLLYALVVAFIIYIVDKYQRQQEKLKYEVKLSQDLARQEKELNEKKLTFFTNISHEFRSPLTMIINPLKDIIYGTDQQIDPAAIEMVYSNSRRLLSLVDQLLLFRKTETETGKLKIGQIDIVELAKEVFSCFVHHAKTKKIDYSFSISEEKVFLYVDREKIEMALFNLISNALKFTEKENGAVAVNLRCVNNEVIITVIDNGEGILEADKEKIFDLFYQSNKNIKNNRKGFGIGLYLVKQFVDQHYGKVNCSNNQNGGATFEIKLLLGKEHFGAIEIQEDLSDRTLFLEDALQDTVIQKNVSHIEEPENVKDVINEAKSILIVDDNPQIRNYLKRILTPKYHITAAESAEAALAIIRKVQPDLIISDVVMGEMNGVAFCKYIKTDEELKHIPVILLTGGTSEEVKLKGAEVGADDYITKPFDNDYLLARISGILTRRDSEQNYLLKSVTKNAGTLKLSDEDKILIERIVDIIDANLDVDNFNVNDLALQLGMSYSLVYKKIKKITGKSVSEFTRNVRLRKVATLLITTDLQISQAASIAGFGDIKYFRKHFQQFYTINPSEFKKKYQNVKDNKYILNESFWKST